MSRYILSGVSLPLGSSRDEAEHEARRRISMAKIPAAGFELFRRSVDARHKKDIQLVYSFSFETPGPLAPETVKRYGLRPAAESTLFVRYGTERMSARPVIAGMGPCGLFAALLLAEHGYRPIVLERGDCVAARVRAVERFYTSGVLDEDSNIQFGAGGAGTFSDGKLVTRINDPRCAFVLSALHRFGAPKEILTLAKPHIGTDILRGVVQNIADAITSCGGEIRYRTPLISFDPQKGASRRLHTGGGDLDAGVLILAIGHSARDTYKMLLKRGFSLAAKDFSVGLRIEHRKADIDRALYGEFAGHPDLPYGEYALSANTHARGVYTFCMCPGGEVVASASERGGLCVNGMSNFARNGEYSNSAICVSVYKSDYGATPEAAIEFQRSLERAAFAAGGGDFFAPASTAGDFLRGTCGAAHGRVHPTYMGGRTRPANLRALFPAALSDALADGLRAFGKKLPGFDAPDALLTGVETRTSAPVRILRTDALTMCSTGDIYPGGEGAGYAGGITSAAVDGVKIALSVMERFRPFD